MWYGLVIFIVVFQFVITLVLPIDTFGLTILAHNDDPIEDEGFWERAFNTDYIFGVAVLEIPGEEIESNYPGMPEVIDDLDLDTIESGVNPLDAFIGLMSFNIVGAEWLSLIFWFSDFVLILCFVKLLRGS